MSHAREELAALALAVKLLTRWPLRSPDPSASTGARPTAAVRYYPLVGALVGAFAGGVFWLAHLVFPATLAIVLATAAAILATGALHEDGFADACDGLGGGATRERALEIMRDSRLGTYGAGRARADAGGEGARPRRGAARRHPLAADRGPHREPGQHGARACHGRLRA